MKNKNYKRVAAALLASGLLFTSMGSTFAMGQGGGKGGGQCLGKMVTAEEKEKLQSMSDTERQEYAQELREKYGVESNQGKGNGGEKANHNEDPSALIADIAPSDVSDIEKEILINQYGEEGMARDLYAYAAEKYPNINTFGNINESEQMHMEVIETLLDRYDIDAPSDYAKDNDLYVTLKDKIDLSEKDAIEAGIMIEMTDINNIIYDIKNTDNEDFKVVLVNIGGASYNHLRGFVNALQNADYTTDLEWNSYITQEEVDSKGGALKAKLAETLENEGVELPESVSSEAIKEKCDKEQGSDSHSHGINERKNSNSNMNSENKGKGKSQNARSNTNETLKNQYKATYEEKYGSAIAKMTDDQLTAFIDKIDNLSVKINEDDYSDDLKVKYNAILEALKEIAEDNLDSTEDDILDSLF